MRTTEMRRSLTEVIEYLISHEACDSLEAYAGDDDALLQPILEYLMHDRSPIENGVSWSEMWARGQKYIMEETP
jgi:hypothetical protein